MICIVNNVLAFPIAEAPSAATADIKVQQSAQNESTESTGFAEKLSECEEQCNKEQPAAEKDGADKKDNGMPDDTEKVALYGIAGILEGFEPLSYQQDSTPATNGIVTEVTAVPAQTAITQGYEGVQQMPAGREYTGELPDQIARMLQNNETGKEPVQTQDDIMRIVGEYLDSLENTNDKKPAAMAGSDIDPLTAEGIIKQSDTALASEKAVGFTETKAVIPDELPKPNPPVAITDEAQQADQTQRADINTVLLDKTQKTALPDKEIGKQEPSAQSNNTATLNLHPEIGPAAKGISAADTVVKETAKPDAAAAKDNVIRIVDKISTNTSEGKYDFDIELKPDFLGKVSIKLTMEDGSMKVLIKAEDASVKALLTDQTSSLQTMLKEKGIPVTHVDVTYGSSTTANFDQSRQEYGRNPQRSFYEQAEGNFESAKERYDFYIGDSRVEFLA